MDKVRVERSHDLIVRIAAGDRPAFRTITARHVDDRIRYAGGLPPHRDSYDRHTWCELVPLLGVGQATARTGSLTFALVAGRVP